jgi:hypothetical protein
MAWLEGKEARDLAALHGHQAGLFPDKSLDLPGLPRLSGSMATMALTSFTCTARSSAMRALSVTSGVCVTLRA